MGDERHEAIGEGFPRCGQEVSHERYVHVHRSLDRRRRHRRRLAHHPNGRPGRASAGIARALRVKCVKETSSGMFIGTSGKDKMVLTGVALPQRGAATRIPSIEVGKFDSGDAHPVTGVFTRMPLTPGVASADYGVVFIIAETDFGGGLDTYANNLVKEINEERQKAAEAAAKKLPPNTVAINPVVVALVKAAAVKIGEEAIERARKNAEDDIFPDRIGSVKVVGPVPRLEGGKTSSPVQTVEFNGHGGRYIVTYSWRVVG